MEGVEEMERMKRTGKMEEMEIIKMLERTEERMGTETPRTESRLARVFVSRRYLNPFQRLLDPGIQLQRLHQMIFPTLLFLILCRIPLWFLLLSRLCPARPKEPGASCLLLRTRLRAVHLPRRMSFCRLSIHILSPIQVRFLPWSRLFPLLLLNLLRAVCLPLRTTQLRTAHLR